MAPDWSVVTKTAELARTLSLTDSVAILVGIVVGRRHFLAAAIDRH